LKSNPVEIEITAAAAAWQQAEFQRIVDALAPPGLSRSVMKDDPKQPARDALRYLGSADAAREMARRLRGEEDHADWDYMFGLIGSPHRDAGLEEMNKLLGDPDFPVGDLFLTTMAILPLDPKAPSEALRKQRDENLRAFELRLAS